MQQTPAHASVGISTDPVAQAKCSNCGAEIDVSALPSFSAHNCPHCQAPQVVPARLGNFLLIKLLGTGGMGGVYIAEDTSLGRKVAIKVMLKSYGDDPQFIENFKREAQAQARLNHPNVGQIYTFGQEKGQPFIVMELISGRQFDKLIRDAHPLHQGFVMRVGAEIASGLKAADEAGLLHGDVKPENILLDEHDTAKLVDFGIASSARQGDEGGVYGTPYYIAPEKVKRRKADARSDMYSLGATLYHAIAGRPPFEGATPIDVVKARFGKTPPPLSTYRKDVDEQVEQIIVRMMQEEPGRRHPTYASLIGDMQRVVKRLGEGRRIGRTIITKKGAAKASGEIESDAEEPAEIPLAQPAGTKGSKIVITKPRMRISLTPTEGGVEKPAAPVEAPAPVRKGGGKGALVFLVLLLVAAIAGGGYAAKKKKDAEVAARRERAALEAARGGLAAAFANAVKVHSNIVAGVTQVEGLATKATNTLFLVLGETMAIEVVAAEPAPVDAGGATPSTNVPPAPVASPAVEVAAPKPVPEPEPPKAPGGLLTREQLDAQRAKQEAKAAPEPPPQEAAAAPAPEPVPAPPPEPPAEPPKDEPELKKQVRRVVDAAGVMARNRAAADAMLAEAETVRQDGEAAATSDAVAAKVQAIGAVANRMQQVLDVNAKALEEAQKVMEKVGQEEDRVRREQELRRKAEDEARKRAEEEEKARQKEAERKALAESEMGKIQGIIAEYAETTANLSYGKVSERLERHKQWVKTDEARAFLANQLERFQYIQKLLKFLETQLAQTPYAFGWLQEGPQRRQDIIGADEKALKLRNKQVPWKDVAPDQVALIVEYFVTGPRAIRSIREQAQQTLAVAVLFDLRGESAKARAQAEKALAIRPDMAKDVERLLPAAP